MSNSWVILVVDDEPDLLQNITLALDTAGFQTVTASNGLEALTVLKANPVALILADIAMPEMNGYQLYERVRQNSAWNSIPFIFLTARALDSDIRYGKEMGVDDYLLKPVRVMDLLAVVRGKLRRAEQLSAVESPRLPETLEIIIDSLRIDLAQHRVWLNDNEIMLSGREMALLTALAEARGDVVHFEELIQATHNLPLEGAEASDLLRPLVRDLRRKLGLSPDTPGFVENVRGVGYRLLVSPENQ